LKLLHEYFYEVLLELLLELLFTDTMRSFDILIVILLGAATGYSFLSFYTIELFVF
jgi:hypothetical protein